MQSVVCSYTHRADTKRHFVGALCALRTYINIFLATTVGLAMFVLTGDELCEQIPLSRLRIRNTLTLYAVCVILVSEYHYW